MSSKRVSEMTDPEIRELAGAAYDRADRQADRLLKLGDQERLYALLCLRWTSPDELDKAITQAQEWASRSKPQTRPAQ